MHNTKQWDFLSYCQGGYVKATLMIACFITIAFITLIAYTHYYWLDNFAGTKQEHIRAQLFKVEKGDNSLKVLNRLTKQGIIKQPLAYRLLMLQQPSLTRLKAGQYRLSDNMTPTQLLSLLCSGVQAQFSVTLIEGLSFKQWLADAAENEHIKVNTASFEQFYHPATPLNSAYPYAALEGMFYPDTYYVSDQSSFTSILERANARLKAVLAKHWQNRQAGLPFETPYQALILASIIEKETAIASEREKIASVFVNRMRAGMRLQTDPTVIYGIGDRYQGDITRAHLREKNPYNTYKINGLPPSPIAMVSEAAIKATLNPSTTPFYYFVAAGDGGHYFSKSLAEHNRALQRYLSLSQ